MKKLCEIYSQFGKRHRVKLALAFFLIVFVGFINMSHQYFFGQTIDYIASSKWEKAFYNLMLYSVLFATGQLMHFGINFIWSHLKTVFLADLKNSLFLRIICAHQNEIDKKNVSDYIKRINYDSEEVLSLIYHNMFYGIANVIKLVVGIGVIVSIKLEFGLLCFGAIPIITAIDQKTKRRIKEKQEKYHCVEGELISKVREFVSSFKEIARLDAFVFFENRILENSKEEKNAQADVIKSENNHDRFVETALHATFIIIYFFGALCIKDGSMTIGQIVIIISYFNTCKSLFRGLYQKRDSLHKNMAAVERIIEILNMQQEEMNGEYSLNKIKNLELNNIVFAYNDKKNILNDISYKFFPAKKVKILGANGEGKTTLIKLLIGLYSSTGGNIIVNKHNLERFNVKDLRNKIGVVWQTPYVIDDTVRNNLILGEHSVTDKKIWDILDALKIRKEIENMPFGLDTVLNPKEIKLSNGQLKRLLLARVLIREPDILILDEITASLDKKTAEELIAYIENTYSTKIIIYVAHDEKCMFTDYDEFHIG